MYFLDLHVKLSSHVKLKGYIRGSVCVGLCSLNVSGLFYVLSFFIHSRTCLEDTETPLGSAQPLGKVYTEDDFCKMSFGPSSFYCKVNV